MQYGGRPKWSKGRPGKHPQAGPWQNAAWPSHPASRQSKQPPGAHRQAPCINKAADPVAEQASKAKKRQAPTCEHQAKWRPTQLPSKQAPGDHTRAPGKMPADPATEQASKASKHQAHRSEMPAGTATKQAEQSSTRHRQAGTTQTVGRPSHQASWQGKQAPGSHTLAPGEMPPDPIAEAAGKAKKLQAPAR